MKVLTYISYKKHCDLYTEMHGSTAVNSCQIELPQKDIILLSEVSTMICKAGTCTGVENTKFIRFNLSAGTYSIDDFKGKIKLTIWQQRQDWEPPQIKDLAKPEDYTFIASNNNFITLRIYYNDLEKTTLIRFTLPPGSYKASLDTSPPPISLSLHCKQINKVKKELDGQPSSLLARMHVCNYKATSSPIHLVFLELDIDQRHLDFKILDKKKPKLSRGHSISNYSINNEHIHQWNQNLSIFKPYGTGRTIIISIKQIEWNWGISSWWSWSSWTSYQKMKRFNTITGIVDTGLITLTVITRGISVAALASGVGLLVGIALSGTSQRLSLATVITRKPFFFKSSP